MQEFSLWRRYSRPLAQVSEGEDAPNQERYSVVKYLFTILLALGGLATALLAIANRQPVVFRLDPLPFEIELPLFLLLLAGVLAGIVLGGFSAWVAGGRVRRLARRRRHAIAALEREVDRLKRQAEAAKTTAAPIGGTVGETVSGHLGGPAQPLPPAKPLSYGGED